MVRNYVRKTSGQSWSEESMKLAIVAVAEGEMGYPTASRCFSVPKSTLVRRVAKFRKLGSAEEVAGKSWGAFQPVFNEEQENELVSYVKTMEAQLFGLTAKELRCLAYQLAERNSISNPFSSSSMSAGKDWLNGFLKRHKDIALRKPEATSAARAMGFNRVAVNQFFEILERTVDKHKLESSRIYNCDETGITTVPKTLSRVLATKGKRQVGSLTSAERGQLVTVELCISADGRYMPPMMVFPRHRMKPELLRNAPPGTWGVCHPSGWMQTELFLQWMKRFIEFSGARKDKPVLLLLDGHATHTKNLDMIDLARNNGVLIICLLPHCTHRLQPLDVSFMKPLSTFYSDSVKKWLRQNSGRTVTHFQIAELFGEAYLHSASMLTAINGFRKTGIWPLDHNVFSDADFISASTTDIDLEQEVCRDGEGPSASVASSSKIAGYVRNIGSDQHVQASCDSAVTNLSIAGDAPGTSGNSAALFDVSIEEIMPRPKANQKKRCSRKRGKTALLTSSPYMKELRTDQGSKLSGQATRTTKKSLEKVFPQRKTKRADGYKNDTECIFCSELYSESNESWISCTMCGKWAHCSCSGVADDNSDVNYVCDLCSE